MFELPLSSNNLRVSHPKFSISDLSQRDVFYSCGLTGYQRQRGREKKYRTLAVPLDALQRLPPGGSRGLWLPANVFPFRRPPLLRLSLTSLCVLSGKRHLLPAPPPKVGGSPDALHILLGGSSSILSWGGLSHASV